MCYVRQLLSFSSLKDVPETESGVLFPVVSKVGQMGEGCGQFQ